MKYIVSRKYKFVYHMIPKCGTRTMLWYFVRNPHEDYGAKAVARKYLTTGYYSFTFVREPLGRILSVYLNKVLNNNNDSVVHKIHRKHNLTRKMRFDEFVDVVCSETDFDSDDHWRSQICYIPRKIDYIGRLESIHDDFIAICNHLGMINYGLPHRNYSDSCGGICNYSKKPQDKDFKDYFTDDVIRKIHNRYKEDFILYNTISLSQRRGM